VSTNPAKPTQARLALADGSIFTGTPFGSNKPATTTAEVVFNTAMTGYQESLTDPSYAGQILVQTAPLIGNTGVNEEDTESNQIQVAGFVVHEIAHRHSNYRATRSLDAELEASDTLAIAGIDTRALVRILRTRGSTPGTLTNRPDLSNAELVKMARTAPTMEGKNLVHQVAANEPTTWTKTRGQWAQNPQSDQPLTVLAIDCGSKQNILRHLKERGCKVKVIPHTTPAEEILDAINSGQAQGLFISNGPGDPAAVETTIQTLRTILNENTQVPIFGICLGHQLLALAAGAKTYKLKFGHRGTNQPVLDTETARVEITSQNHGFAVDANSILEFGGHITHLHLNDGTVAGFRLKDRPVFAVQFHPESSPGPHDAAPFFDRFIALMTHQMPLAAPQSP
jgi:carbamoyl-phosphate synthase small subunit